MVRYRWKAGVNVWSAWSAVVRPKSIANLFAAMVLFPFALSGCNPGVAQDTYVVQITTDMSPHVVQLNQEVWKNGSHTFQPVLSLKFPRAYYNYRDNQDSYRQTVVGLSLNKQTLGPLALDLARQVGGTDQTQLLRAHQRNAINEILVTLGAGATGPGFEPRSAFTPDRRIGSWEGFEIYRPRIPRKVQSNCTNSPVCQFGEEIVGVTPVGEPMNLDCVARSGICSISFAYDEAIVELLVPAAEVARAAKLRSSVLNLLNAHRVK